MGFERISDMPVAIAGDTKAGWQRMHTFAYYHVEGEWKASVVPSSNGFLVRVRSSNGAWEPHAHRIRGLGAAMLHAEALVALAT